MSEILDKFPMYEHYKALRERFSTYLDKESVWYDMYNFIYRLIDILSKKCFILENLKNAYDNDNKEFLRKCADKLLPELVNDYTELADLHEKQWMSTYKSFGFEVLDIRYGGVIKRLKTAIYKINAYIEGKTEKIEELEEKRLLHHCEWTQRNFSSIVTACNSI